MSVEQPLGITLEDHTADPDSETSRGLWAQSVSVEDHAVVQGKSGVGAYVAWSCRIQTLDVRNSLSENCFPFADYDLLIGRPDCHSHEVGRIQQPPPDSR